MRYLLAFILCFFAVAAFAQRPYIFDNISQASSANLIGIGAYVQTKGFTTAGDGGGAVYEVTAIANAPMAVDSGYVYPINASKVLVQVLDDQFLRSATYGIVCGDSGEASNNYNRLQRFFNAIDTLDKQAFINGCNDTLYVDFSSALTVSLTSHDAFVMKGEGSDITRIKASTGTIDFGFSDASKVSLFDLWLDSTFDASGFGYIGGSDQQLQIDSNGNVFGLTINGGNTVFFDAGGGGGGGTDDQQVDTFDLNGTYIRISLESDGVPLDSVDLSSLQDGTGTDDQTITLDSVSGTYNLSIEDGNTVKIKRDTDTDDQTLSVDSTTSKYQISIQDGNTIEFGKGVFTEANDLTSAVTWANVPDANITQTSVTQHQAALTITESQISDLSHTVDTDNQQVDTFDLNGNFLRISLQDDAVPLDSVDLSSLGGGGDSSWTSIQVDTINAFNNTPVHVNGRIDQIYGGTSTALGYNALANDDGTSNNNVAVGYQAGDAVTSGTDNIAIGYDALSTVSTTSGNVAIGYNAGRDNVNNYLTAIGHRAAELNTGAQNTALGYRALGGNTSQPANVAIGYEAGSGGTIGNSVMIGYRAGYLSTSYNSVFIGASAGADVDANGQTIIGFQAMSDNKGAGCTVLGFQAGRLANNATTLNLADSSIFIGHKTTGIDSVSNQIVIGNDAAGNGANTVTIGNSSVTDSYVGGTVHATGAYVGNVTTFNTAADTTAYGDYICHVAYTTTGTMTLTIATANVVAGYTMIIKDADGNAGTNNITVATEGSENIDGSSTATISSNYGALRIYSDGTNWFTY